GENRPASRGQRGRAISPRRSRRPNRSRGGGAGGVERDPAPGRSGKRGTPASLASGQAAGRRARSRPAPDPGQRTGRANYEGGRRGGGRASRAPARQRANRSPGSRGTSANAPPEGRRRGRRAVEDADHHRHAAGAEQILGA